MHFVAVLVIRVNGLTLSPHPRSVSLRRRTFIDSRNSPHHQGKGFLTVSGGVSPGWRGFVRCGLHSPAPIVDNLDAIFSIESPYLWVMYSRRRRTFRWHSEAFFLRHFAAAIEKMFLRQKPVGTLLFNCVRRATQASPLQRPLLLVINSA